ncbi:hypothetical protein P9J64_00645 [Deltaproteobacteria bacterium IMCC39524]|nr:hypothetical protein [Deltaproteobacteria bacterium IMCC39524]
MKLLLLVMFLVFIGCSPPQQKITTGEFEIYATVIVTEDWCYMSDNKTKVNGTTKYFSNVKAFSQICVSLKSDDPERTLQHELAHAWRNAVGLDVRWVGHNNVCTSGAC